MGTVNTHTVCGVLALVLWVYFLASGHDSSWVGIVALFFYWHTALVGLLIWVRWARGRGKHASGTTDDSWSEGPGLSVLAHVGMLVGVLVFTWYFGTHSGCVARPGSAVPAAAWQRRVSRSRCCRRCSCSLPAL